MALSLADLDSDDAVDIFEDLDEEAQQRSLAALPRADRLVLEESLRFPEDSAGRIMQRDLLAVPSSWTVGETIDYRSEEHTSELQSLMRISYAVFCLKKTRNTTTKQQMQKRQLTYSNTLVPPITKPNIQ